jgi:hypothetical protein
MTHKARIAHLAGPNATIQTTPPLVTSNKPGTESLQTRRWRELDSNLRFRDAVASRQRGRGKRRLPGRRFLVARLGDL